MNVFNTILGTITKRLSLEEGRLDDIALVMSETTGLSITTRNLSFKKGVVAVSLPPTAKMALFLKRDAILRTCEEKGIRLGAIV